MTRQPGSIEDALDTLDGRGFVTDEDGNEHNDDEVFAAVAYLREEIAASDRALKSAHETIAAMVLAQAAETAIVSREQIQAVPPGARIETSVDGAGSLWIRVVRP